VLRRSICAGGLCCPLLVVLHGRVPLCHDLGGSSVNHGEHSACAVQRCNITVGIPAKIGTGQSLDGQRHAAMRVTPTPRSCDPAPTSPARTSSPWKHLVHCLPSLRSVLINTDDYASSHIQPNHSTLLITLSVQYSTSLCICARSCAGVEPTGLNAV